MHRRQITISKGQKTKRRDSGQGTEDSEQVTKDKGQGRVNMRTGDMEIW